MKRLTNSMMVVQQDVVDCWQPGVSPTVGVSASSLSSEGLYVEVGLSVFQETLTSDEQDVTASKAEWCNWYNPADVRRSYRAGSQQTSPFTDYSGLWCHGFEEEGIKTNKQTNKQNDVCFSGSSFLKWNSSGQNHISWSTNWREVQPLTEWHIIMIPKILDKSLIQQPNTKDFL